MKIYLIKSSLLHRFIRRCIFSFFLSFVKEWNAENVVLLFNVSKFFQIDRYAWIYDPPWQGEKSFVDVKPTDYGLEIESKRIPFPISIFLFSSLCSSSLLLVVYFDPSFTSLLYYFYNSFDHSHRSLFLDETIARILFKKRKKKERKTKRSIVVISVS